MRSSSRHDLTLTRTFAKKTSVLATTGRPVTKVQRQFNAKNADTFEASMVGYDEPVARFAAEIQRPLSAERPGVALNVEVDGPLRVTVR